MRPLAFVWPYWPVFLAVWVEHRDRTGPRELGERRADHAGVLRRLLLSDRRGGANASQGRRGTVSRVHASSKTTDSVRLLELLFRERGPRGNAGRPRRVS